MLAVGRHMHTMEIVWLIRRIYAMPVEFLVVYFVSLAVCSLSTIYKTACFDSMPCRLIMGSMFWSLVPVVNTLKALLWLVSLLVEATRSRR